MEDKVQDTSVHEEALQCAVAAVVEASIAASEEEEGNEVAVTHVAQEHKMRVRYEQRSCGLAVHVVEFHSVSPEPTFDDTEHAYRIENGYFVLNSSCNRFIK